MQIEIFNTSSPGASFTDNTNSVLLKIFEWIKEHPGLNISFKEFRVRLENDKEVNDNNNRNIFPLLKNGRLVQYEKGGEILVDKFYTNTGLAYVKTLELLNLIKQDHKYTKDQVIASENKLNEILQNIIYGALLNIVNTNDLNYVEPFQDMIQFLLKFQKISKEEYAYLLFERQRSDIFTSLNAIADNIHKYRANEIKIETSVTVRNDIEIQQRTSSKNRQEGLSFLTSYGYFVSLLNQAGLIAKQDKYYAMFSNKRDLLEKLIEE